MKYSVHCCTCSKAVDLTDRKWALQALQRCAPRLSRVRSLLCDSGYVGQPFEQGVKAPVGEHVTVQIAKRSELHTFKVMPKRWVVERGFAWLEKNRRLWKTAIGCLTPACRSSIWRS